MEAKPGGWFKLSHATLIGTFVLCLVWLLFGAGLLEFRRILQAVDPNEPDLIPFVTGLFSGGALALVGAGLGLTVLLRRCGLVLAITLLAVPAQAQDQEISRDGRSVVGHTTALDRVFNALQPDVLLIGLTSDELVTYGEALYPEEGTLHNRAGHRLGARILTNRFGPVAANALGIANELYEAWNLAHTGHAYFSTQRFDWEDVGANVRGTVDSLWSDLNTPWGALRTLEWACGRSCAPGPTSRISAWWRRGARSQERPMLDSRWWTVDHNDNRQPREKGLEE